MERGAETRQSTFQPPCSMSAISPLARAMSFPGEAEATPDKESLSTLLYKIAVSVLRRRRAKVKHRIKTLAFSMTVANQRTMIETKSRRMLLDRSDTPTGILLRYRPMR